MFSISWVVIVVSVLFFDGNLFASETDDRIESTAKESYVFKTYLKDDDIAIQSRDGVVTLTGTVSAESHKPMAWETVASLPGVKSVENKLVELGGKAGNAAEKDLATKLVGDVYGVKSVINNMIVQ